MPELKQTKQVTCACGNRMELDRHRTWCEKCGQAVYYDARDQRKHKFNNYYIIAIFVTVMGFLTYIFIEMIAKPLW